MSETINLAIILVIALGAAMIGWGLCVWWHGWQGQSGQEEAPGLELIEGGKEDEQTTSEAATGYYGQT